MTERKRTKGQKDKQRSTKHTHKTKDPFVLKRLLLLMNKSLLENMIGCPLQSRIVPPYPLFPLSPVVIRTSVQNVYLSPTFYLKIKPHWWRNG